MILLFLLEDTKIEKSVLELYDFEYFVLIF